MDHLSRPRVCEKKRRRDRLIGLAQENPDTWVVGFEDETWWSRLQRPSLHSWAEAGKKVWLLIWDNASWHTSKEVREWLASHNRRVKKGGSEAGVRIISCLLPKKSPWLNPMEPRWVHGKRRVVEPDGLLSAQELAERVCLAFDCPHYEHLSIPENVA